MKHLVLGSEGQIGKYVCDKIKAEGDEIIEWDIVNGPEFDLREPPEHSGALYKAVREADFVHFLAYDVGGARYLADKQNSLDYIKNNIDIMTNVFRVLENSPTPFYFASSQMENMPESMYGRLKGVGEGYTKALGGLNVRFWNVYGYERDPEKSHVITDFIKMALTEGRIICRTDGSETRHFSHAEDVAANLYHISTHFDEYTQYDTIPLISKSGQHASIYKIAKTITHVICGTSEGSVEEPYIDIYTGRHADKTQSKTNDPENFYRHSLYSHESLKPKYANLKEGIADMVERIKADLDV